MELELLDKIIPRLKQNSSVLTGPGDDCAVVEYAGKKMLFAVDQVIENIHFTADTPPERAGAKLVKRNLSDIAAMGGRPLWMMLTIANGYHGQEWLERFISGVEDSSERYGVPVIGGDTSALDKKSFAASISICGEAARPVLRSGAIPGDTVYVTGLVGNSFLSEHHLDFEPHLKEGVFLADYANAMMDISDGLLLDIQRMAKASGADFIIDTDTVPLRENAVLPQALSDGEDYGLILTCRPDIEISRTFRQDGFDVPLTAIGKVVSGSGKVRNSKDGLEFNLEKNGYEH